MAELDYAFFAEYAKVEPGGKLTAVGASYTHVFVQSFPAQQLIAVAGRIRATIGEKPILHASMISPDEVFRIDTEMQIAAGEGAMPYGPNLDTVGLQFALTFLMPLPKPGLYELRMTLDGEPVRLLAFTAVQQQAT